MSLIVAGRFDTFAAGENAAQGLFTNGFVEEDVFLFFVNPAGRHDRLPIGGDYTTDPGARDAPKGASRGMVIGAVIGAIIGVVVLSIIHAPVILLVIGAGVGAWIGSLVGAMRGTPRGGGVPDTRARSPHQKVVRDSGVLVAVHVTPDTQAKAREILRAGGAKDVERATGRWSHGRWADFDPLTAPTLLDDEAQTEFEPRGSPLM